MSKPLAAVLIALMLASPAPAQDNVEDLLDDFMRDAERSLRDLFQEARPGIEGLIDQLRLLPMYEAPVILPNGDILIRRKRPDPEPGGVTDI